MIQASIGIPTTVATPLGIAVAVTGGVSMVVAVATLVKAVMEYRLQNSLKRFEKYQEVNKVYQESSTLTSLRDALEAGGRELADFDPLEKLKFMSFYQDIAMMCQSGLMRIEVAAYLFGFDTRIASTSKEFVSNLGDVRNDPNWILFWAFCERTNHYWNTHVVSDKGTSLVSKLKF